MARATPYAKLSNGFYEYISALRENHELEDLIVKVDGKIFPCHRFILATCSKFFRRALSDKKEKHEMTVELNNISSPIFQLILNSLYTGCELLTKENVLKVWLTVHKLQIQFLIEHCEDFVMDNLSIDTVDSYEKHAEYLQSQNVCEYIFNFTLKNFDTLRENEVFFQMDLQFLEKLLKSDKLDVENEDSILYSIFKWVNYTDIFSNKAKNESNDALIKTLQDIDPTEINEVPKKENSSLEANGNAITEEQKIHSKNTDQPNERKKNLIQLLKSTRYYLASVNCIFKLYKQNLSQNDIFVKDILLDALIFKLSDHCHGHWPSAAIHRDCSDLEHVGVFCDIDRISALSLKQKKWFYIPDIKTLKYSKLTVFKGKLYACSIGSTDSEIYVLNKNDWELVTVLNHSVQLLLAHEESIYLLDSIENVFIHFNPDMISLPFEKFRHELRNPEYALSFHDNILVFCSVQNKGFEETSVHSWNTHNNEWTHLVNLDFSSRNMTSFRDDLNTYILDSNGDLRKLTNTEVLDFTFVAKLWSVKCDIKGAVLFRETLFILRDSSDIVDILKKVKGVFSNTIAWSVNHFKSSNFIHYVIPKSDLVPLQNVMLPQEPIKKSENQIFNKCNIM